MSEWQPMHSAPTDGTPILLRLPEAVHHAAINWEREKVPRLVSIGRWHEDEFYGSKCWIIMEVWMGSSYGGETNSFEYAECDSSEPTGWMPLPPP